MASELGEAGRRFWLMAFKFSSLKRAEPVKQVISGIGHALDDLWEKQDIHPLDVAASALENGNNHTLADVVRYLAQADDEQVKAIHDKIEMERFFEEEEAEAKAAAETNPE